MSTLQWADKDFKVAVLNMFKHLKENKYIEKDIKYQLLYLARVPKGIILNLNQNLILTYYNGFNNIWERFIKSW